MTARSPSAFALSAALHGAVAVLVLASLWLAQQTVREQQPVFELVAGPGDNFAATEAPSSSSLPSVKFRLPPTPPTATPANPAVTPAVTPAVPETIQPTPRQANKPAPTPRQANKPTPASKPLAPTPAVKAPHINGEIIASALTNHSTASTKEGAGGKALTRAQSDEIDSYFSMLEKRLRAAHQEPDGLSELLQAQVEFHLNADGSITGVRVIVSSSNPAFDQSVRDAFRRMVTLPSPPPGFRPDVYTLTFKMSDDR